MQIGARLRRHSRFAVGGTVVVGVFALAASVAWATGTLDQQNPGPAGIATSFCGSGSELGQTFTAGLTGALDTVQLGLFREEEPGETTGPLVVSIEGTGSLANPGTPDEGDVLATQTVPEADIASRDDFSTIQAAFNNVESIGFDNPAQVVAGTKYAIVVAAPDCVPPQFGFTDYAFTYPGDSAIGSTYSGGDECVLSHGLWECGALSSPGDHVFATYVTVPPAPPSADVAVSISGPTSAKKGALITYLITVSNAGPDTAHNVVLTDPVPSGASFVGVSSTKGSCTPPRRGGPITCQLGDLVASSNALSSVSVKVIAKAGSNIANIVSAQSTANGAGDATPDPQPSNNSASLNTNITK